MYLMSKNEYIDSLIYVPAAVHGLLYLMQVRSLIHLIDDPFRAESAALLGNIGY